MQAADIITDDEGDNNGPLGEPSNAIDLNVEHEVVAGVTPEIGSATTSDIEQFTTFSIEITKTRNQKFSEQPKAVADVAHLAVKLLVPHIVRLEIGVADTERRMLVASLAVQAAKAHGQDEMAKRIATTSSHYSSSFVTLVSGIAAGGQY